MRILKKLAIVALICSSQSMMAQPNDLQEVCKLLDNIDRIIQNENSRDCRGGYCLGKKELIPPLQKDIPLLLPLLQKVSTPSVLDEQLCTLSKQDRANLCADVAQVYESLSDRRDALSGVKGNVIRYLRAIAAEERKNDDGIASRACLLKAVSALLKKIAPPIATLARGLRQSAKIDEGYRNRLKKIEDEIAESPYKDVFAASQSNL
jgi:hypothetical protein